jgi:hypothetical protein
MRSLTGKTLTAMHKSTMEVNETVASDTDDPSTGRGLAAGSVLFQNQL